MYAVFPNCLTVRCLSSAGFAAVPACTWPCISPKAAPCVRCAHHFRSIPYTTHSLKRLLSVLYSNGKRLHVAMETGAAVTIRVDPFTIELKP